MQKSDFRGAAAEYAKSVALDPKQAKVWEKLAFCRVKMGEKDAAAEDLVKLADLKTESAQKAEVLRNAAGIYLQGPDQAKAERYLLEAVRLDPNDEASLTWLGELASANGGARFDMATAVPAELDKALGFYDRLVALRPDAGAPYANRRIVCVKYLGYLGEQKSKEEARLRKGGKDAADAKERLARIEAKSADLRRIYEDSNAKLASLKKAAAK